MSRLRRRTVTPLVLYIGLAVGLAMTPGVLAEDVSIPLPEGAIARCGTGRVHDVECSSDGRIVALATSLGVELLDHETFEMVGFFGNPLTYTVQVALSPDGKMVAAATDEDMVLLWDVPSGTLVRILRHTGESAVDLAFSPDGSRLAVGSSGSDAGFIYLWDVEGGEELLTMSELWLSGALAFSPDAVHLALGGEDGSVRLLDLGSSSIVRTLRSPQASAVDPVGLWRFPITSLAYTSCGLKLAAGTRGGEILLWDAENGGSFRAPPRQGRPICGLSLSPDDRLITWWTDSDVALWDLQGTVEVARGEFWESLLSPTDGHEVGRALNWRVAGCVFEDDGISLSLFSKEHEAVRWSPETEEVRTIAFERRPVSTAALAFSADGTALAVGSRPEDPEVWKWTPSCALTLVVVPGGELHFLPGGNEVFSMRWGEVRVWGVEDQRFLDASFGWSGYNGTSMDVSDDGTMVAIGSADGAVTVWDAATHRFLMTMNEMSMFDVNPLCVAFSHDSRVLAVCQNIGRVQFWSVETWTKIGEVETSAVCIAAVPNEQVFRTIDDSGNVVTWDGETAQEVDAWKIPGYLAHWDTLDISQDGGLSLAASGSEAILFWGEGSEDLFLQLSGHTATICSAALSPDGTLLATASSREGTILLWDVDFLLHGE